MSEKNNNDLYSGAHATTAVEFPARDYSPPEAAIAGIVRLMFAPTHQRLAASNAAMALRLQELADAERRMDSNI